MKKILLSVCVTTSLVGGIALADSQSDILALASDGKLSEKQTLF